MYLWGILVIINGVAIWQIISSRKTAEVVAQKDLQLQAIAYSKALETVIASRRGDFIFLSQASPLAFAPKTMSEPDPVRRKWGRLDIEGAILLFLEAHPEVEKLIVRNSAGTALVVAGRREGAPVLLSAADFSDRSALASGKLVGVWPLREQEGQGGTLEVVLDVPSLLKMVVPGLSPSFSLVQEALSGAALQKLAHEDFFVAAVPVRDDNWPRPVLWTLIYREDPSQRIESVSLLAARYRVTVILNLFVMSLALILGVVAVGQVRRSIALEAENRQQARVRELERQVIHSERLASVGRLAAGMAHEINNPLEGMSNYLSLLEDDLQSGGTRESIEVIARIRQGLDRVAGVIRQVLTFSDRGTAPFAPLDLAAVLDETVRFVKSNPRFRKIDIKVRYGQDKLLVVGNRVTLGQLFLNLLLNACELQQEGGDVEIESSTKGGRARIAVRDRGPGFAPEVQARLFEPFFSTRGSTGLGLSVCHGIVAEHGGSIQAENRPEGGACFIVEFPVERISEGGSTLEEVEYRS